MNTAMNVTSRFLYPMLVGCLLMACSSNDNRSNSEPAPVPGEPSQVVRVIDGDSLELLIAGEATDSRLVGVNAPELYNDNNDITCAGVTAKELLEAFLATGPVQVATTETDRFGRALVDVSVNELLASDHLVRLGWGLASGDSDTSQWPLMMAAAEAGSGMWGAEGCGAPAVDTIRIDAVQTDAPGNDRNNLNEEWVRLANVGPETVDLAGWVLRDKTTGHAYTFGSVELEPDSQVTVRSGTGQDTNTDLYWNETFPVWSNTGEVVLVVDPQGVIVTWLFP